MKGFQKINIRFFIYDYDPENDDSFIEVNETEFLDADGVIEYERHSVKDNGVRQICLTKYND